MPLENIVMMAMKCPNCNAEVHEEDKFCGECGENLRREIEIAPKWKWGSMVASLAIVFFIWLLVVTESSDYGIAVIHIVGGIFVFPAIIYLMYKERTEKIKYGLIWILLVVVLYILDGLIADTNGVLVIFLNSPAVFIDLVYVYKTR
jgi:uncharacterized OB-fold protein